MCIVRPKAKTVTFKLRIRHITKADVEFSWNGRASFVGPCNV